MSVTTTIQCKLIPNKYQEILLKNTMKTFITTINGIVDDFCLINKSDKRTSKDVDVMLPSCLKNQCINDAKSVFKKYKQNCLKAKDPSKVKRSVLKKAVAIWNNQNYKIEDDCISFPVFQNGKSKKIFVKMIIPKERKLMLEQAKLGTLRITMKNRKMVAQISVLAIEKENDGDNVMGVDLGLKNPAVCYVNNGKIRFVGNGRKNKYLKRKFRSQRKKLGKAKKLNAIKKSKNKEQRIMRDIDHKISKEVIDFAVANQVSLIRMEKLTNIRATARTSRKNEKNLHTWSFYRLAQYIEYKAKLCGIKVKYVNPAYTSQACVKCGKKNHAKDRKYQCSCGYHGHRDIVGAINITRIAL